MVLKLRSLLAGPMRKMVGPPPSTSETEAAFRWAGTDADGSLSLSAFLAAQVVSRELNAQWEGRQACRFRCACPECGHESAPTRRLCRLRCAINLTHTPIGALGDGDPRRATQTRAALATTRRTN